MTVTELIEKHSGEIGLRGPGLRIFAIALLEMVNKGAITSIEGNEVDGYTVVHDFKVAIENALEELRK